MGAEKLRAPFVLKVKRFRKPYVSVEVLLTDAIDDLKQKIFNSTGWTPEKQKLIFEGHLLHDLGDQTLEECNIFQGDAHVATIQLAPFSWP